MSTEKPLKTIHAEPMVNAWDFYQNTPIQCMSLSVIDIKDKFEKLPTVLFALITLMDEIK